MVRSFQPLAEDGDAAHPVDRSGTAGRTSDDEAGREIDLRGVATALRRRRRFILLPTVAAAALVGLYVTVATPRYTAQSQILLENQESFFTRPDRTAASNEAAQLDEIAVASQVQLLTSHDLARRAIAKLKLVGNDEFDSRPGLLTRLLQALHLARPTSREAVESRIVDAFEQKLVVFSPPKTRVVTVEFTSRDADLAARAANAVAELYISEQAAAKRTQARTAADALSEQIADLRGKLAKADAERERYRSTSGLLAGSNNMTVTGQQVADLNGDLSRARAMQADAQAKASTIRSLLRQGKAADVAEVTNNEIVRRIWDQRSTAQAQLALESRTLLPGHPRVKELQAQVEGFDATLRAAARQLATTLENEAQIAGARVGNLETALAQQKAAAGVANGDEVHLRALERIAQGYKDQLESSTTKYEEALARQGSLATPADARIISRALPPQMPSFPKKLPFIAFGTVATLVFTAGWVIASELLSGRVIVAQPAPAAVAAPEPAAPSRTGAAASVAGDGGREVPPAREATEGAGHAEPVAPTRAAPAIPAVAPVAAGAAGAAVAAAATPPRSFFRAPVVEQRAAKQMPLLRALGIARSGLWPSGSSRPGIARPAWLAAAVTLLPTVAGYVRRFGQSAVQSGRYPRSAVLPAAPAGGAATALPPSADGADAAAQPGRFFKGSTAPAPAPAPAPAETCTETPAASPDVLAQRIVAAHVPGRGLHIVGTGVGDGSGAADKLIVLARALSGRGRALIVDLGATPARLAALWQPDRPGAGVLPGLSELLSGDSSFAEVIHRDRASRLHFIPPGALEADFRDFDLILDALSQTYDFIMLLAPAYPRSEIARVMAPYADVVVLAATGAAGADLVAALEAEMIEAGARDVLVVGRGSALSEVA